MTNTFAVLKEKLPSAIERMPSEFDTHRLILELARENQRAYIDVLHESDSEFPFQTVHASIGRALKQLSLEPDSRIKEKEAKIGSLNIFGVISACSKWERL